MRMRAVLSMFAAVAAVVFLASCGGGRALTPASAPSPALLAGVPPPPDVPRGSQALTQMFVLGADAVQSGGLAMPDGDSLVLSANPGQFSYAMYALHTGAFEFNRIDLGMSDITTADHLWFALADYSRLPRVWEWTRGTGGFDHLDMPSSYNRNSDGDAYVVIAAYDNTEVRINFLLLNLDLPEITRMSVSSGNNDGEFSDIAVVAHNPEIIFQQTNGGATHDLRLAVASTASPSVPSDWTLADMYLGYPGLFQLRMVAASNAPGVALIFDDNSVWYACGSSAAPTDAGQWAWSSPAVAAKGQSLDLAVVLDNPALTYIGLAGNGGEQVMYARSTSAKPTGTPDWEQFAVGEAFTPGQQYGFLHLTALEGDQPALSFYDEETNLLTYVYSANSMPLSSADLTTATVDTELYMGQTNAIFQFLGTASLVYHAYGDDLYFARSLVKTPTGPEDFVHKHVMAHNADYTELDAEPIQDGVAVAYRDLTSGAVKLAWTQGGTVESGAEWKTVTVDERLAFGYVRLAVLDDGSVGIVYYTIADDSLNYAHVALPPV